MVFFPRQSQLIASDLIQSKQHYFRGLSVTVNSKQEWLKIFQNACIVYIKCTTGYILFRLVFLRAFRSNISLQFCSLLDGSFKIFRYLCDKRSICPMFNCGIQTPTRSAFKKRGHHQILKTNETFLLIFGMVSLLNSYFDGMRNPFSFSFIQDGKEFQN